VRIDRGITDLPEIDRWIARVRVGAALFAAVEVGLFTETFPPGYELWAWIVTALFAAGAMALLVVSRSGEPVRWLPAVALAFDTAAIASFGVVFAYEYGSPTRWALILAVVEGALRFGILGGVLVPVVLLPYLAFVEWWRADRFGPPGFIADRVTFPFGVFLITGLICGWLVGRLAHEANRASVRAAEAERLRDELGRRVDLLESANRCARALASSLRPEEAFDSFIREFGGVVAFDRLMVMRIEEGSTHVVTTAGLGAGQFPEKLGAADLGRVLERALDGRTQYRSDLTEDPQPEELPLIDLGLRSRIVAPLQSGGRVIGIFSVSRLRVDGFTHEEVELVTLLGRLIATSVQNIRAYEAERMNVEELRRLSELRSDFVSMVSHELRSPMAAVIGSARTLQQRGRDLEPEQRDAFLAVIADETSRLALLVEDVLHTSRIEAGTFSYRFAPVDLARLVRESIAAAELSQQAVRLRAELPPSLPEVRGDPVRLRQLLDNLIGNAVKFSRHGEDVHVSAAGSNGAVTVTVRDEGPGIAPEHLELIFEKFGRAAAGHAKPGTGLGLFIARSIAEAHGGELDVESTLGRGSAFTVRLPV